MEWLGSKHDEDGEIRLHNNSGPWQKQYSISQMQCVCVKELMEQGRS